MIIVAATPNKTIATARIFRVIPPFRNEEKKPRPTCMPMENTKRIKPNAFVKWRILLSIVSPKWPQSKPIKSTKVMPREIPITFIFPNRIPTTIQIESNIILCPTPVPNINSSIQLIIKKKQNNYIKFESAKIRKLLQITSIKKSILKILQIQKKFITLPK